ncbi:hypothetical protein TNCV_2068101 [Trichonephila clavipes]|uniref:Uncharacterized protein n=1 Tax=Trichonephila clavipes TaxID=2585209 RepID=A0A8X6W301_TRICX|nr:hypothetical protein TNCV_2068101 [Trichonephila clavipes]
MEQVVAIHSGMAAKWAGLDSSQVKRVEVYSQNVMSGGLVKTDNSLSSLHVPRNRIHSGQGFPRLLVLCVIAVHLSNSFTNPTPLAHADTSRDVLPREGSRPPRWFITPHSLRNAAVERRLSESIGTEHRSDMRLYNRMRSMLYIEPDTKRMLKIITCGKHA